MNRLEFSLLNNFQHHFPLTERPFAALGEQFGVSEATVLASFQQLHATQRMSRIGPVFSPNRIGRSTLAALAVPEDQIDHIAASISARPEINHNYRREHHYNLWFVATAAQPHQLNHSLAQIADQVGYPVLSLPMEREYHIDLGFDLAGRRRAQYRRPASSLPAAPPPDPNLVAALQTGLALVPQPFAAIAAATGLSHANVIAQIQQMLHSGIIKRFGVVVRHHELGWQANAMCVWDVPDPIADELGAHLANEAAVTLCYRRRRGATERAAGWPYNLFCMIHGQQRQTVEQQHAELCQRLQLGRFPSAVLFSTQRYKQCGARYAQEATHA